MITRSRRWALALTWLALAGAACAARPRSSEALTQSPVTTGEPGDRDGGDLLDGGALADATADGGMLPAVTFTRLGCIFEGKKYSPFQTFLAGGEMCGCFKGTVSCRPRESKECFAKGQWTRPGEWGPASDGCNSMRCPTDTLPTAMTLVDCRVALVERIAFSSGSAALSKEHRQRLEAVAEVIKTLPARYDERPTKIALVEVAGHADKTEPDPKKLAQARADAVRDALVQAGVPSTLLKAVGYGADHPIAPSTSPESRAMNRLVEFSLDEAPQDD